MVCVFEPEQINKDSFISSVREVLSPYTGGDSAIRRHVMQKFLAYPTQFLRRVPGRVSQRVQRKFLAEQLAMSATDATKPLPVKNSCDGAPSSTPTERRIRQARTAFAA